ncbi:MAG: flagellar motor protein MotB [Betaproteobacteria bacterium]|nr:MAG: flagellar motor protein MotB [Betaproteobacteria bacterium]
MPAPSASPPPPPARRRWLRRIAYAAGAVALLVVVAWLAVPPIVRSQLESRLTEALGRATTVEAVAFDPFALRITVRGLAIADREGPVPLLAVDELAAGVSPASLWRWAPVLDAVRLVRPRVHVARDERGRYNVADLIERARAAPEGPPPRFSLNNIEVDAGTVAFDDRQAGRRHEVAALDVAIPFLSSLPYQTEIVVVPRLAGVLDGARFALAGSTLPFAERREATLDVDLDALPLARYVAYLPARPAYDLADGTLTTRLSIAFVEDAAAGRRLEVRGSLRLDDVAIRRRDGSPLVGAEHVAVSLDRVSVLGREARVASVFVEAPRVAVVRRADGTLELAQPLFAAPAREAGSPATPAAAAPAWFVSLAKLEVARGIVALADETSGFRSTLVDVALEASNLTSRRGDKAQAKLAFVTDDRIASFAAEAEVEPLVPAATGRFALGKFSLPLLFPYYREALAVDVQKGSLDLAARFVLHPDGRLVLDQGDAAIGDLRLALPGQKAPLWRIPTLGARGVEVDVAARRVTMEEAHSRDASLRIVREPDGTLEMARFLRAGGPAAGAGAEPWTVLARKLVIEGASIDALDRVPDPDVRLAVRGLDATIADLSSAPAATSRWSVRARVGERGRLAFTGPLTAQPFALSGTLDASGLALATVRPYVEPHVNVVVTEGTLAARGRFAVAAPAGGPLRATWRGSVSVGDFAALDKPTSSDLARWKSLALEDLDVATTPFRASVARIALDEFFARAIVYPDATVNLARLLTPGESPEPAPGARPAAQPAAPGSVEGLPVSIGRIELRRGRVDFTDLFVQPNYAADLTDVAGSVSTLSREQAGDVALAARVAGSSPVEVQGRIHPFAPALSLDLAGRARDIDLPPLSPYAVKYAGYGIEKGKLTFDVRYVVENRKLEAKNRLVLDQLTFGPRVESPTATKLPVLLAVALLKDARGVIDIDLPIVGSIDDPQFSVGGLIVRVIVNLITKAVTAPFALLSAAFGGGEELSTLDFAAGSDALDAAAGKRIDTLGKALVERPGLKLDIAGGADASADGDALRRAAVERALRTEKMKALAAEGKAPASLDEVAVAADERERWLAAAYRASSLAERPRDAAGALQEVPPAQMEAIMAAGTAVDDEALRRLATRRAQAVKDALVARGVAGERLFLVAPQIAPEPGGGDAKAASGPRAPARVDLALR